eukprot:m.121676 g.121676  ORF g.121676 m.121676 type:complete len:95 (+) comp52099_c0_seq7:26-310(+)
MPNFRSSRFCRYSLTSLFVYGQRALALHLTKLHGRMINVELTVGGGGTSENRQAKIEKKNKARRSLAQVKGEAERTKVRRQQEADFRRKTWRAR